MEKRLLAVISMLVMFAGSTNVWAWNGYGHSCAAYIAEQHLTPEAKAKCEEYLQHSFVFHASWMDKWRFIGAYKPTTSWHVIRADENWKLDESEKRLAEYQTTRIWKEMKDYKNLPDSLVRQNLIYLIHMVPDFHCPVHIFLKKGEHPDKRYNLRKAGKKFGLHTFWDRSPGFHREGWTMEKYAEEVDKISPKLAKKYQKGDAITWAKDAVKQAERAYPITPVGTDITTIPPKTVKKIHALSDEMILKGAYRLAYIINDIFKE